MHFWNVLKLGKRFGILSWIYKSLDKTSDHRIRRDVTTTCRKKLERSVQMHVQVYLSVMSIFCHKMTKGRLTSFVDLIVLFRKNGKQEKEVIGIVFPKFLRHSSKA